MKLRILHITESLNRGGAEVLLLGTLNALPDEFENIVVYLEEPSTLATDFHKVASVEYLNYKGKIDVVAAAYRLSKIIHKYKVDLVHSHLYWPTIIARIALWVKPIPLIFSVHSTMTDDAFGPNVLSKYLEKLTYTAKQTAVFVSETALQDYAQHISLTGNRIVLHNFVRDEFYAEPAQRRQKKQGSGIKLVSVGNLRPQKGHLFLMECVHALAQEGVSLDIYGEGHFKATLQAFISQNRVTNVRLMGSHSHLEHALKQYDAFVYASRYEGFCLAMAEAMTVGLPCIVPDLKALEEVSGGGQLYYPAGNKEAFSEIILKLLSGQEDLETYARAAREKALAYTSQEYIGKLVRLYHHKLKPDDA
ncbi:glycosyltransferase family 4 protein [Pontibacter sp. CAU 1760]